MTTPRRPEFPRNELTEFYALPPPAPTEPAGDEIDLRALLGTLLNHKRLILAVTGLGFVLALAYVFIATPVYEANALVQVSQAPAIPGVNAVAQAVGADNPAADDAVSILTSQSVIKEAVDQLNLNIIVSPYRVPVLGNLIARQYTPAAPGDVAGAWPGFGRYDWGGSQLDVPQLEVPSDLYGESLTLIAGRNGAYSLWQDSAIPFLRARLLLQGQVGRHASGSGVTMLVNSMRANPGTRFHVTRNYEVTTITGLQKAITAKQVSRDSSVIQLSLDSKSPHRAVAILDVVTKAYLAQNVGRNAAQATSSLEFVRRQLPVVKQQLEDAQAKLNAYQLKAHSVDVPMQTQSLLTRLDALDANIQQLETQRIAATRLFTPEHPEYKSIVSQIGALNAQKADINKQLNTMPDTQRELLNLNGNVQVLNTTYTGLLNEAQQLELAQAGTVGTTRIVDPPSVDITQPVKPKKALVILGGTFVGGFFAVTWVFLRQMLNRTVEDATEIKQLGLPVYASIPWSDEEQVISRRLDKRFGRQRPHKLLALAAPTDVATEALRGLRTSLSFSQHEAKNNLLMVCGSTPNAGKTFVCANLAAVVAQAGQQVLLIDANMRDGQLHKVFGGPAENGLSELIAGQISLEEAVRSVPDVEDLDFVSCGATPLHPSDLLMNPEFGVLLRRCSAYYDLVVIDSPPILAVTDAAVIGRHVGTCLLVVRYGLNQTSEIALAKERLMQSGVNVDGVIFNAVERQGVGHAYGSYGDRAV